MINLIAIILLIVVLISVGIMLFRLRTPTISEDELDRLLDRVDHAEGPETAQERAVQHASLARILNRPEDRFRRILFNRQEDPLGRGWYKSNSSGWHPAQLCVEVKFGDDNVQVRDSKNPGGPRLSFTGRNWERFIRHIDGGPRTALPGAISLGTGRTGFRAPAPTAR